MAYYAKIRLDEIDGQDTFKATGKPEEVLIATAKYIQKKDHDNSIIKRLANYLADDFDELGKGLERVGEVFIPKKKK